MKEGSNAGSRKIVGQKQERYLVSHNFGMNTESSSVHKETRTFTRSSHIEIAFLSLFLVVVNPCLSSVLRIHWWGADQFNGPSGTPSSGSTHEIDVFSIFIADFRLRDSLEASEKLLQYIFHNLNVGLWCEVASTRLAIPSGEVFDEHVT
jgi:hypothetical protein